MIHTYLIALGSNIRHHWYGRPSQVLNAGCAALDGLGRVAAMSPILKSDAVGPSRRRYANAAALLETDLDPGALLTALKHIERDFGMRRGGRWQARILDLDIILWNGGIWASPGLTIPHRLFRERPFVLQPAAGLAPGWRDPISSLSLRQLNARLTKPRPMPR